MLGTEEYGPENKWAVVPLILWWYTKGLVCIELCHGSDVWGASRFQFPCASLYEIFRKSPRSLSSSLNLLISLQFYLADITSDSLCIFFRNGAHSGAQYHTSVLLSFPGNQPTSKTCTHAYLSPYPFMRGEHNATAYDSAVGKCLNPQSVLVKTCCLADATTALLWAVTHNLTPLHTEQ